jgi:SAM-dependent methyltransferase
MRFTMSSAADPLQQPADQATYWNEEGGRRWVENIDRIERMIAPLTDDLLALAAPRPGERVLDVGCGGGVTSAAFAAAVGADGHVLGVDVSAVILDVARRRYADHAGLAFAVGDAATLALDGFHLVTSRFGVMFFPAPQAAFANLRRALCPGGRLAFVCWRTLEENPWMAAPTRAAFSILPRPEPALPGAPGPFAFADPERLRGILAGAGFSDIAIEAHDPVLDLGSPDEALEQMTRMGPAAPVFAVAEPAAQAATVAALRAALEPWTRDGRVVMPGGIWRVRAQST